MVTVCELNGKVSERKATLNLWTFTKWLAYQEIIFLTEEGNSYIKVDPDQRYRPNSVR